MSKIKQFDRHYILCGVGRIGRHILEQLVVHGEEVVVVERDVERIEGLGHYDKKTSRNQKVVLMEGNAHDDNLLMKCGIMKAQAVFCCLVSDQDNLLLTVTVKNLNTECLVYTRLKDMNNEKKFFNVGADHVVSPQYIGGVILANQAVRSTTIDFFSKMLKQGEHQIEEVVIPKGSWVVGKTLAEVDFQRNIKIYPIAIKSGEKTSYSPPPEYSLAIDDILIFVIVATERQEIIKFI